MWSYFGSKTNVVRYYPPPRCNTIIESFAGTARYSLRWGADRDVILIEKYEVVARIWQWLLTVTPEELAKLPRKFKPNQHIDDFIYPCEEARWLIGFLIGFGMERPRWTASADRMINRPNHLNYSLQRIAANLPKIRHWKVIHGDYRDIPNREATWFIDPPYQFGGDTYVESNRNIDYDKLADWCKERKGQVIVCENHKATWLPFKPLAIHKGARGMMRERIWSNEPVMVQGRLPI